MKIGFAGVYRDMTGYGHAALDIIKALDAAGLDVAIRPVHLTHSPEEIPDVDFYNRLESKSMDNVDVMIQSYLPELMVKNGRCKNVGHFFCETTNFRSSNWAAYLNMMDAVCVASPEMAEACSNSDVRSPVWTIPQPVDVNKYQANIPEMDLPGLDGKYVFYSIGDYSTRKNYQQLVRAYLTSFTRDDNVMLVLKTFIAGRSSQESYAIISKEIDDIKRDLRLHRVSMYPQIILICDRLSEAEMMALHATGDCFIIAEHGSGWGIPAFDAMAMGKQVIAPSYGSHNTFLKSYSRYIPVPARLDVCYGVSPSECPYHLYTARELWGYMTTIDIMACMKRAVQQHGQEFTKADLTPYSYKVVGEQWAEHLRALCK